MRSALILGGSGTLGSAIARELASSGAHVGLVARGADRLERARASIEGRSDCVRCWVADVRDVEAIEVVCRACVAWAGGLDTLVFAAGRLGSPGPLDAETIRPGWDALEISLKGVCVAMTAARSWLARSPCASFVVLVGPGYQGELAHASLFGAAQAGLVRLVESLSVELESSKIRVYAVYPGLVPSPFLQPALDTEAGRRWLPRFNEAFAEGKELTPRPTAEMVAWLALNRPACLSGRVIPAAQTPEVLEMRLPIYESEPGLGRLRMR